MQLSYRGTRYEPTPKAIDLIPSEITARYRGNTYSILYPANSLAYSLKQSLRFRDVVYTTI